MVYENNYCRTGVTPQGKVQKKSGLGGSYKAGDGLQKEVPGCWLHLLSSPRLLHAQERALARIATKLRARQGQKKSNK